MGYGSTHRSLQAQKILQKNELFVLPPVNRWASLKPSQIRDEFMTRDYHCSLKIDPPISSRPGIFKIMVHLLLVVHYNVFSGTIFREKK